jgi:sec-independent protein translocase protein TatA
MTILAWMIGWTEIAVIVVVAVLIFGRRLPEVGRSMGQSLVEFKKGLRGEPDDANDSAADTDDKGKSV